MRKWVCTLEKWSDTNHLGRCNASALARLMDNVVGGG